MILENTTNGFVIDTVTIYINYFFFSILLIHRYCLKLYCIALYWMFICCNILQKESMFLVAHSLTWLNRGEYWEVAAGHFFPATTRREEKPKEQQHYSYKINTRIGWLSLIDEVLLAARDVNYQLPLTCSKYRKQRSPVESGPSRLS